MEYVLLAIVVLLVLWFFFTYNKFVRLIEAVKTSKNEISIQLDRRGKVFDNLIATVKKYMEHEEGVLTKITELRQTTLSPTATAEQVKSAQDDLSKIVSSGSLESSIKITMENYPELKANTNMLQFQEEIVSTENKLSFSKKAYNNAVNVYNVAKGSIPSSIVPSIVSNLNQKFEYWSLNEDQVKTEEARKVSF